TPPASGSDTSVLAQPATPTRITAQTRPNSPRLPSTTPARSILRRGPNDSASRSRASGISTRPTGTFSRKIARQPTLPARAPPATPPAARRPARGGEPADAAPRAEQGAGAPGGRPRREHRQGQRYQQRAARSLHRPGRHQRADRRRERGGRRPGREDRHADRE